MDEDEVRRARDFLVELIGAEYPAGIQLGALMEMFKEKERELLA